MNELVRINQTKIAVKEFDGKRVVTLKEIDAVHQRPDGTARKRFNDNKKRMIEGTDFFKITPSEFRTAIGGEMDSRQQNDITLVTESGYLMLVKSFTDDLAWEVQRKLVNTYFRMRERAPRSAMEYLKLQSQALFELNDRVDILEDKVDNQMTIDHTQQRFLQKAVSKRVYERARETYDGRELRDNVRFYFNALYKDLKNRFGVPSYLDIRPQDYDAATAYVVSWVEPAELRRWATA